MEDVKRDVRTARGRYTTREGKTVIEIDHCRFVWTNCSGPGIAALSPHNPEERVKLLKLFLFYHVSYSSLLVRCHHVVNKGCRLSPSASLRFLCLRINCTLCSRRRRALCFGIHRTLCLRLRRALRLAFIAPCVRSSHPASFKRNYD